MPQINLFDMQPTNTEKLEDGSTILYKSMEDVMATSMLPYAEHVILDRALPRVEDGLKPVQRRILYSMYEQGVLPDKNFRKSARIVGDCMGRYHPHGDTSIYDAMVRMAQPFCLNATLVKGQGNFGNVDGDGAAAMRYTEAKLSPIALELIKDIEKNTVTWSRNFDDTTREPNMLPGRFPNLLVNGASGIAVGLATNIPPHNLAEVIDGVVAYIDNKYIKLSSMMKIIKGPDFPTGGHVVAGEGLAQAYETGKGKIVLRANCSIEAAPNDRCNIVITELPYQVSKSNLLIAIAKLKDDKKELLSGISEIVDESDKEGMRAVIKLRKDTNPKKILETLFKHTALETSFYINIVAIADGKPQQMGLLDIISYYTNYQREVVLNRSKYELATAKDREHILQGLVIAVQNIDKVIAIIRASQSTTVAKQQLRLEFDLSDRQAQAILDLRLARLTKLETGKLIAELEELKRLIARLTVIIGSKAEQMALVKQELTAIKRTYKEARKSQLHRDLKNIVIESEGMDKPIENVIVALAGDNTIKRIPIKNFTMSNKDVVGAKKEMLINVCQTMSDAKVMIFTSYGNCYQMLANNIKECKLRDDGLMLSQLCPDSVMGEVPIAIYSMAQDSVLEGDLLMYTRQGMVKRSKWTEYNLQKKSFQVYKGKEGDEIFRIEHVPNSDIDNSQIFVVTNKGGCAKFGIGEVPTQGRIAGGVKIISLSDEEYIVYAGAVKPDKGCIFMVTNKGYCKNLDTREISSHGRGCKGSKGIDWNTKNGNSIMYAEYVLDSAYNVAVYGRATTHVVTTSDYKLDTKTTKGKAIKGIPTGFVVERVLHYKVEADTVFQR